MMLSDSSSRYSWFLGGFYFKFNSLEGLDYGDFTELYAAYDTGDGSDDIQLGERLQDALSASFSLFNTKWSLIPLKPLVCLWFLKKSCLPLQFLSHYVYILL